MNADEKLDWNDFKQKVAEYAGIDPGTISEQTNVFDDLGLDSLGLFSMGTYLIRIYSVTIPLSSVARIQTVHDIFTMMNEERYPDE